MPKAALMEPRCFLKADDLIADVLSHLPTVRKNIPEERFGPLFVIDRADGNYRWYLSTQTHKDPPGFSVHSVFVFQWLDDHVLTRYLNDGIKAVNDAYRLSARERLAYSPPRT